jgi:hypothetical protein
MGRGISCSLSLFTWICIKRDGRKAVVPLCPSHPSSKVRFRPYGFAGMIVTCHEEHNHLVRLCQRERFEAEQQEAQVKLCCTETSAQS